MPGLCATCRTCIEHRQGLLDVSGAGEFISTLVPYMDGLVDQMMVFSHHSDGLELKKAADDGCFICGQVWERLTLSERMLVTDKSKFHSDTLFMFSLTDIGWISTRFGADAGDSLGTFERLAFMRLYGAVEGIASTGFQNGDKMFAIYRGEELDQYRTKTPPSKSTSSETTWNLITGWLQNCVHHHSACKHDQPSPSFYPSRLIQIDLIGARHPKLVLSQNTDMDGPYITLSHCWGKEEFIKLTKERLTEFLQDIDPDQLPRTFQDVLLVAKRLNIQDDHDDWLNEASAMHKVYRHCLCNVASTASSTPSDGLFRDRATSCFEPCVVNIPWLDPNRPYEVIEALYWGDRVQHEPLNQRAWVVQERLLAPRVIHFGREEVFWECHEAEMSERYPNGLPPYFRKSQYNNFKKLNSGSGPSADSTNSDAEKPNAVMALWAKIACTYSRGRLSHFSDKAIALAGIAKHMKEVLKDEYVAGMWKSALATQLTWRVERLHKSSESSLVPADGSCSYVAPSWSWLSVNGTVNVDPPDSKSVFHLQVVNVAVEPLGLDPMGAIKAGFLHIRGVVKFTPLIGSPGTMAAFMVPPDHVTQRLGDSGPESMPSFESFMSGVIGIVQLDACQTQIPPYCYFVPIKTTPGIMLEGIVILPTGGQIGEYRRLGAFISMGEDKMERATSVSNPEAPIPPHLYYHEDTGEYTILLV